MRTLSRGPPGCPGPRRGGGCALLARGAVAAAGRALSVAGVVSRAQLRQLEMQLEQEYEEKQMVLHEKQDLEGLIGTLCEQVRARCPPRGQPKHPSPSSLLPPGQPSCFAGCAPAQNAARKKGAGMHACVRMGRLLGWSGTCGRLPCPPSLASPHPPRPAVGAAAGAGGREGFGRVGIV